MNVKKWGIVAILSTLFLAGIYAATTATVTVHWFVPTSFDITMTVDANCGADIYHVENDGSIDGTQTEVQPYGESAGTNICQGVGASLFRITNNGTAAADLNAEVNSLTAQVTQKIWQSSDATFCGEDGNSGYESTCSDIVTLTSCAVINTGDRNIYSDLASNTDANFCMAADFNGVAQGDNSATMTVSSGEFGY